MPATVQRAARVPVLGAALLYVVASDTQDLDLLDTEGPLQEAPAASQSYWRKLRKFLCAGLPLKVALSFHSTFVNGAITHFLRASFAPEQ